MTGFPPTAPRVTTMMNDATSMPRAPRPEVVARRDCQYCREVYGCVHADAATRDCRRHCDSAACELAGQQLPRSTGICLACFTVHHADLLDQLESD